MLGDAEFGDNATLRRTLHRLKLPYALGISSTLTVFRGTPPVAVPPRETGPQPAAHATPTDRRHVGPKPCARSPRRCRRARGAA